MQVELQKLCDKVPSFDNKLAMETIERELGKPVDEIFSELSADPVGTANKHTGRSMMHQSHTTLLIWSDKAQYLHIPHGLIPGLLVSVVQPRRVWARCTRAACVPTASPWPSRCSGPSCWRPSRSTSTS